MQSALSAMAIPGYIPGDYFRRIQAKSGITGKTTARSVLLCLVKNWIGESFRHVYSFSTSTGWSCNTAVQGGIDIEMISKSLGWLKLYGNRNKKRQDPYSIQILMSLQECDMRKNLVCYLFCRGQKESSKTLTLPVSIFEYPWSCILLLSYHHGISYDNNCVSQINHSIQILLPKCRK